MKKLAALVACLGLAACAGVDPEPDRQAWGRIDGRPISTSQRLTEEFAQDSVDCRSEAQKSIDRSDPVASKQAVVAKATACMDRKGYELRMLPADAVVETRYGPVVGPTATAERRPAAG